jgi:hypothetical protein
MVRSRLAGIAFVLGILVHWTPSARADVLDHYSFTGANGLSGNFTLDISAGLDSTGTDQFGTGYQLVSPFSILAGSYGLYTFGGNTNLQIFDSTYYDGFCCADSWIVRAGQPVLPSLSGNIVNGRSVTGLNLFIGALFLPNVASPVPPAPPDPHRTFAQYSYTIGFSDGTFDQGSLGSLQFVSQDVVAEPATLTLLIIGILVISLLARKTVWTRSLRNSGS